LGRRFDYAAVSKFYGSVFNEKSLFDVDSIKDFPERSSVSL